MSRRAKSRVRVTDVPAQSLLHQRRAASDFIDCYCIAAELSPRAAATIVTRFPGWVRALLVVRRWLTAPFGLFNDGPDSDNRIGPFPVEFENQQELIAGFDDKHLNFRISVMSIGQQIFLATWVHPHHVGGRIYLSLIMPFHILIARNALQRVAADSARAAAA